MTPARRGTAPPVRHVHLGLGGFFRAHQAWYAARIPDAAERGIAAFSGSSRTLVDALRAQDGCYSLVTRGPETDEVEVLSGVVAAYPGGDVAALVRLLASPDVDTVTLTVTEAGYRAVTGGGGVDVGDPAVAADLDVLRSLASAPDDALGRLATAPGRLLAGLAARRRADAGPLTLLPCDNLPGNGTVLRAVLTDLARHVDTDLAGWLEATVGIASTEVDRITPALSAADVEDLQSLTGGDRAPVVTEPFAEWSMTRPLMGSVAAHGVGPDWAAAGALVVDDVEPYERRKLWLLNGAHCLLAYAGLLRGHRTVSEAFADNGCRAAVERWWDEAGGRLGDGSGDLAAYRRALAERFGNARIGYPLRQIAADGSQKLPARVLPVLHAERDAGRVSEAAITILGSWVAWLRTGPDDLRDPRATELREAAGIGSLPDSVRRCLAVLDPALAEDRAVAEAVVVDASDRQ